MRRVIRPALPLAIQANLNARQAALDAIPAAEVRPRVVWKAARQSAQIGQVLGVLRGMMGERARCMYCVDSHGVDIDHFWPKTAYRERMFVWQNLLLSCTECGRFKGDQFPLANGEPLLVDPSIEDPWLFLDFDPQTGNVTARFSVETNSWSAKGSKTVEVLHLDRREALAAGYRKTLKRLLGLIEAHSATGEPANLGAALSEADDHGLLGWLVIGTGRNLEVIRALREHHADSWEQCVAAVQ